MSLFMGQDFHLQFSIPQTELLAGTAIDLVAPVDGFVSGMGVVVQTAVTTGGTVTANVNGNAVDGLSVEVENSATKGTVVTDGPTAAHPSRVVKKGDRISIVPSAAFDTAGALNGYITINTGK